MNLIANTPKKSKSILNDKIWYSFADNIVAILIRYAKENSDKIKASKLKKVTYNVGHPEGVLYSVANKLKEKEKEISRKALLFLLHGIEKAVEEKKKQQLNPKGGQQYNASSVK